MTDHDGRSLGSELRGARLGFRWADEVDRYLRLSDHQHGWLIEVCRPDRLPRGPGRHHSGHRAWWESDDIRTMLLEACLPYMTDEPAQSFVVDDNGALVHPPPAT